MKITYSKIYDISILIYMCALLAHTSILKTDRMIIFIALGFLIFATILKNVRHRIKLDNMFMWYALFCMYAVMSVTWAAFSRNAVSHYLSYMVQILIVTFCINSNNGQVDVEKLIKYYLVANVYTIIRVLLVTPFSQLFTLRFGMYISGMNSNTIGIQMAVAAIFSLYFIEISKKKKMYIGLFFLFSLIVLLTGSKKSLLILGVGAVLFGLLGVKNAKIHKILMRLIIIAIVGVVAIRMVFNNPYLYEILGRRLERFMGSLTGTYNANDISFNERVYFIEVAKVLFKRYPMFGCGLHNFSAYLAILRYHHIAYSHNNYWEMLSCLGIVGTVIYYSFFVSLMVKLLRQLKKKREPLIVLITIVAGLLIAIQYTLISYQNSMYMLIIIILYCYTKTGRGNVKNENC